MDYNYDEHIIKSTEQRHKELGFCEHGLWPHENCRLCEQSKKKKGEKGMSEKNELQPYIKDENLPVTAPDRLIALALEKGADPATLSKLMDLQERWEAGNARKAYIMAMTAFKQEAPAVLVKGDKVDFQTAKGRTSYNYANLGSIVQEITAILGKHDLSASWETGQDDKGNVSVTCHLTHSAGHRESVTLNGPADDSGNKNRIQAVGSTVTYLQRYTLLAALGLATGEDDDGRQGMAPNKPPMSTKQPQNEAEQGEDIVETVSIKKGTGKKGPWVLYGVKIGGVFYNTFSDTLGGIAEEAHLNKMPVKFKGEKTERGHDLKSIEIVDNNIESADISVDSDNQAQALEMCRTCMERHDCDKQPDHKCKSFVRETDGAI